VAVPRFWPGMDSWTLSPPLSQPFSSFGFYTPRMVSSLLSPKPVRFLFRSGLGLVLATRPFRGFASEMRTCLSPSFISLFLGVLFYADCPRNFLCLLLGGLQQRDRARLRSSLPYSATTFPPLSTSPSSPPVRAFSFSFFSLLWSGSGDASQVLAAAIFNISEGCLSFPPSLSQPSSTPPPLFRSLPCARDGFALLSFSFLSFHQSTVQDVWRFFFIVSFLMTLFSAAPQCGVGFLLHLEALSAFPFFSNLSRKCGNFFPCSLQFLEFTQSRPSLCPSPGHLSLSKTLPHPEQVVQVPPLVLILPPFRRVGDSPCF